MRNDCKYFGKANRIAKRSKIWDSEDINRTYMGYI